MKTKRSRKHAALYRQWELGLLVQQRFWEVAELATVLRVSKATVQRDLEILADLFAFYPVQVDPQHRQRLRYRMRKGFQPRRRTAKRA